MNKNYTQRLASSSALASDLKTFFDSINYLSIDDLDDKPTLEKIKKLSPLLNDYNPLTYTMYLQLRPDLPADQKHYYQLVVNKLVNKEKALVDEALKYLEDNAEKLKSH